MKAKDKLLIAVKNFKLRAYVPNPRDTIAISWDIYDVRSLDRSITKAQAREVLRLLDREHDANIGINWDAIQTWIDYVKETE